MNHKAIDFEIERLQQNNKSLLKDRRDLINALRELQSDCVNKDSSAVIDGDAFAASRNLLTKMNVSGS